MSLNTTYHFHKIKITEPAFSDFYFELFKKVDYSGFREFIIKGIKDQLRYLIMSGKDIGVMIDPDVDLYKPLKQNGYPYNDVVYVLRELGQEGDKYLENFSNYGSLKITSKGKKWVMNSLEANQTKILTSKLNYFDIPDAASPKLMALLVEINDLNEIGPYKNLIGHQLRTILNLILKHICKNILEIKIPNDKKDLRPLLCFVISQLAQKKEKRLEQDLIELKDSKYKDIIDDIIHDDHTTVNLVIIEKMMNRIKHILSLAFR